MFYVIISQKFYFFKTNVCVTNKFSVCFICLIVNKPISYVAHFLLEDAKRQRIFFNFSSVKCSHTFRLRTTFMKEQKLHFKTGDLFKEVLK